MAYYRIDLDAARRLVASLRDIERRVVSIQQLIAGAELLADMTTATQLPLDQIGADARQSAQQIDVALRMIEGFRIRLAAPFDRLPEPIVGARAGASEVSGGRMTAELSQEAPRWDAVPQLPWDEVHQVASHNSYLVSGGVDALFGAGVRAFELDIHRGAPTDFTRFPIPGLGFASMVAIAVDHLDHGGGRPGDWRVYHASIDSASEYEYLSEGLRAVASLDTSDPLTIFVDNKDPFDGGQNSAAFDQLLESELGARLFGPAEVIARVPGASTVREAIDRAGWPTVEELEGRIIVVVTDELASYDRAPGRAFVAPAPVVTSDSGIVAHIPQDDAVFYNANALTLGFAELVAVQGTNSLVRTYSGPRCEQSAHAQGAARANYRAVDVFPGEKICEPDRAQQPPETAGSDPTGVGG